MDNQQAADGGLAARKRALLRKMLEKKGVQISESQIIKPRPTQVAAPLSFAQERLWLLDQLQGLGNAYGLEEAINLDGPLDAAALHHTLIEVYTRHETLRAIFPKITGKPSVKIQAADSLPFRLLDLSGLVATDRENQIQRLQSNHGSLVFDLAKGPLVNMLLIRCSRKRHVLLSNMSHIVSDGWSAEIFHREVSTCYNARLAAKPTPLQPLPIQYGDFAFWQKNWIAEGGAKSQLAFWCGQLEGIPPLLTLPYDKPRPPIQTHRGAELSFKIGEELDSSAKDMGHALNLTPFMLYLAGFAVLLSRYSGQDDVAVGTPIANRNHPEIEGLIGFFVNTLVIRINDLRGIDFRTLLTRMRNQLPEVYANQDLPFEQLVDALQPERNAGYAPLFQVMFAYQDTQQEDWRLQGLAHRPLFQDNKVAKFDLTLVVARYDQKLYATIEYNSDLFESESIIRMRDHWLILLDRLIAKPDEPLISHSLLSTAERRLLLDDWSRLAPTDLPAGTLHQRFESAVERFGDAVAVVFDGLGQKPASIHANQHASFSQLNTRANQLAHHLRTRGLGPESRVGLCVYRSIDLLVGHLGILKAGAAYVPLDPDYPSDRLKLIIGDAGIDHVIAQRERDLSQALHPLEIIPLDDPKSPVWSMPSHNPDVVMSPMNLANVIYTSGSTGTPKGVQVPHAGLVNLALFFIETWRPTAGSRFLQFSSSTFDVSLYEIYGSLLSGGKLCLANQRDLLPGKGLIALLERQIITHAFVTPSALAALPPCRLKHLRLLQTGGEACSAQLIARWAEERVFLNLYGPTETSVAATLIQCDDPHRVPPIGRPVGNLSAYITDSGCRLVPVGISGELVIGGIGVTRGYLHRPDLTAANFIPDPFGKQAGGRLYRSGDLVRFRSDGQIEFQGRIDHQVKIRGFRIEPGEIEYALIQQPDLREALVLLREDQPGEKRLVAYVVPNRSKPTPAVLRERLLATLPKYMTPEAFVIMDAFPLNRSGKINRAALPKPEPKLEAQPAAAPSNDIEKKIAAIWRQVLPLDDLGANDNFFEFGGNSMKAVQLLDKLDTVFPATFLINDIFDYPTIAKQAEQLIRRSKPNKPANDGQPPRRKIRKVAF